jgi:hypothetical protein
MQIAMSDGTFRVRAYNKRAGHSLSVGGVYEEFEIAKRVASNFARDFPGIHYVSFVEQNGKFVWASDGRSLKHQPEEF